MFISKDLVFVELQKTGCTHIRKLLSDIVGGSLDGKHNYPIPELMEINRPFVGSIRNPWELYVSLWAFGCDQKGGLYERATRPRCIGFGKIVHPGKIYYQATAPHCRWGINVRKKIRYIPKVFWNEMVRAPDKWKSCYTYADDAHGFRKWLHRIHNSAFRFDFGEGYGFSPIHKFAGLLTYRYLSLFCRNNEQLFTKKILSYDLLKDFEKENLYISHFIRNENLEDDLIKILISCGVDLTEDQKREVFGAQKTNISSRGYGADYYYDNETMELVNARERFIIEKFGYTPPALNNK